MSSPRIALVCDWLTTPGGAEKVLLELHHMYPDAPIYTSQYSKRGINWFDDADVRTGWLQICPRGLRKFLGIFRQIYFSYLDLSDYDIVISVTGAEAKAVKTSKTPKSTKKKTLSSNYSTDSDKSQYHKAKHICYCHVPTQYYWELYDQYLDNPGFGWLNPLVRFFFKLFVKPLRKADFRASQRVDHFVTISHYAAGEIKKYYHREAQVIAPPVDVTKFSTDFSTVLSTGNTEKSTNQSKISTRNPQDESDLSTSYAQENGHKSTGFTDFSTSFPQVFHRKNQKILPKYEYCVISCRQVTWKRVDLAISACLEAAQHLVVIGDGPEHQNLVRLAQNSELITFIPWIEADNLAIFLQQAKAYIFPSLEPFGIAPVEALAAGCPVIAYAKGGSKDFVEPGVNGLMFQQQDTKSLLRALREFDGHKFKSKKVAATAQKFSTQSFEKSMHALIKLESGRES